MDFKTATDRLTEDTTLTLTRVAEAFGVTLNSLSRMRTGTGANKLSPPKDWRPVVARLAREEAGSMRGKAEQLEGLAEELERETGGG